MDAVTAPLSAQDALAQMLGDMRRRIAELELAASRPTEPALFAGFEAVNGTGFTANPNDVGNAFHNYGGGNSVTLTTGASALVIVGGRVQVGTANKIVRFGVAVSGASTLAAADARAWASGNMSATGTDHAGSRVVLLTGLTPGSNTFTACTKGEGGSYSMTVGETNIAVFAPA